MALPKRLIEVDLPIKRISAHARREKSIRHGHISTLHIWWARRPLAACRAVICAALWPDPADQLCPESFRAKAREEMTRWAREHLGLLSSESFQRFNQEGQKKTPFKESETLRTGLLDFIADFANWDNSTVREYLDTSRALTQTAHESLGGAPGTRPLVVDPFAGGGSIPLEALRVGADAWASDLNPIPVLLNKVVLEYIPKYGQRLADEVSKWGEWIKREAEKELAEFYPKDADRATPIAYIWARTVLSEAPGVGEVPVEIPLLRSMWLAKKKGRSRAFRWKRDSKGNIQTEVAQVDYANGEKRKVFKPLLEIFEPKSAAEVEEGPSKGGAATCPISGFATSVESVRRQLATRFGGASDARLVCVVTLHENSPGRTYRVSTATDVKATQMAARALQERLRSNSDAIPPIPDGKLNHLRGFFNIVLYGMTTWGDLFSPRQKLTLMTLSRLVRTAAELIAKESDKGFANAIQTCLGLAVTRHADINASLSTWHNVRELINHVFARQALPMVWDFAEANTFCEASGAFLGGIDWIRRVLEQSGVTITGQAEQASATEHPLPSDSADLIFTDPPYYAAIPYADLSDFFYSWLRRTLLNVHPQLFNEELSPKERECVSLSHRAAMYRHKDSAWFEKTMAEACSEARRVDKPAGIGVFVFANKETSGWEAMLTALVTSGWIITASWPVDTEMGTRLRARNSAVLASSVHLVCRPRENADGSVRTGEVGDWRDVLQELPRRIHDWMPRLAEEGIVGADAIFACLGPALEIFSRYSRVEKASGEGVTLKEYLEQVWAAVAKEALALVFKDADTTGFEADARLTAMWLWTLNAANGTGENGESADEESEQESEGSAKKQKTTGFILEYDAARKIAQGLGANLDALDSLVEIKGDTARLLPVAERARFLFGKVEGKVVAARKKREPQLDLFKVLQQADEDGTPYGETKIEHHGETVLDRIHQSMILFAAGRGEALKRFLVEDGIGRDQRFWRLAQALSALYPSTTDEKRWIDGVLARKKSLGF